MLPLQQRFMLSVSFFLFGIYVIVFPTEFLFFLLLLFCVCVSLQRFKSHSLIRLWLHTWVRFRRLSLSLMFFFFLFACLYFTAVRCLSSATLPVNAAHICVECFSFVQPAFGCFRCFCFLFFFCIILFFFVFFFFGTFFMEHLIIISLKVRLWAAQLAAVFFFFWCWGQWVCSLFYVLFFFLLLFIMKWQKWGFQEVCRLRTNLPVLSLFFFLPQSVKKAKTTTQQKKKKKGEKKNHYKNNAAEQGG